MTILFGNLGDGSTRRAFAAFAAVASLGAIAIGAGADRYSQAHRAAFSLTSILEPRIGGSSQSDPTGVDYATTGSFEPGGQRELVVLGSCRDISGQH